MVDQLVEDAEAEIGLCHHSAQHVEAYPVNVSDLLLFIEKKPYGEYIILYYFYLVLFGIILYYKLL